MSDIGGEAVAKLPTLADACDAILGVADGKSCNICGMKLDFLSHFFFASLAKVNCQGVVAMTLRHSLCHDTESRIFGNYPIRPKVSPARTGKNAVTLHCLDLTKVFQTYPGPRRAPKRQ